jgi:hypothetical protein
MKLSRELQKGALALESKFFSLVGPAWPAALQSPRGWLPGSDCGGAFCGRSKTMVEKELKSDHIVIVFKHILKYRRGTFEKGLC